MAFVQNILGNLGALKLGGAGGKPYRKTLIKGDFTTATNVATYAGKFTKIGEYVVGAQTRVAVGQGSPAQPYNQGYIYCLLNDEQTTPAEVTGMLRISVTNANETEKIVVFEEHTSVLHGDLADRAKLKALPEDTRKIAGEDDKILLEFMPDADAVTHPVTWANCTLLVPVTVYQ